MSIEGNTANNDIRIGGDINVDANASVDAAASAAAGISTDVAATVTGTSIAAASVANTVAQQFGHTIESIAEHTGQTIEQVTKHFWDAFTDTVHTLCGKDTPHPHEGGDPVYPQQHEDREAREDGEYH